MDFGTSKYLLDVMEEARKNPGWCPQGRIALSTTALDREYDKVNKHTKIQINELASIYGKTWQTDGWTDKRVRGVCEVGYTDFWYLIFGYNVLSYSLNLKSCFVYRASKYAAALLYRVHWYCILYIV